jgi:hypothetical protein
MMSNTETVHTARVCENSNSRRVRARYSRFLLATVSAVCAMDAQVAYGADITNPGLVNVLYITNTSAGNIINSGTVMPGSSYTGPFFPVQYGVKVQAHVTLTGNISNSGTILASSSNHSTYALIIGGYAVAVGGAVINSGLIAATSSASAINLYGIKLAPTTIGAGFTNSGTVTVADPQSNVNGAQAYVDYDGRFNGSFNEQAVSAGFRFKF